MHGSILTTLYTKLPFAHETVSELLEQNRINPSKSGDFCKYDNYSAIVDNFLPEFHPKSGEISVSFRLLCRELDTSHSQWQKIKSSVRGHQVRSVVSENSLHETHGHNLVILEERDESGSYNARNIREVNFEGNRIFRFTLIIFLQKLTDDDGKTQTCNLFHLRRTSLFARELIGGYRYLVSCLQSLIGVDPFSRVIHGKLSESNYHATLEDSNRLMCYFGYFVNEYRNFLGSEYIDELTLKGSELFIKLINDYEFLKNIRNLSIQKRICPTIIRRKLLEFSIYHSMKKINAYN